MTEFKTPKPTDEAKAKALAVSKKAGALALAAGKGLAKAAENGLRNSVAEAEEAVTVFKPSIVSRGLDLIGRTLIASPHDLGMPPDFYWSPADRAVPRPQAFNFKVMEDRIFVDAFRRSLFRKVSVLASIIAFSVMGVVWLSSTAIHAVKHPDDAVSSSVADANPAISEKTRKCKQLEKLMDKNAAMATRFLTECL